LFLPKLEFTLNSPSTLRSFPSPRFPRAKYTDSTTSSPLSCHTVAGGDNVNGANSRDRRLAFARNSRHSPSHARRHQRSRPRSRSLSYFSTLNRVRKDACPADPDTVGPTLLLFLCVESADEDTAARIPTSPDTPGLPRSQPPPVTPGRSTSTDICSHRSTRFRFWHKDGAERVTILYTSCEHNPIVLLHCNVFSLPSHAS